MLLWSDGTKTRRNVGHFSGSCWLTPWPTSLLGSHSLPSPKLGRVDFYKKKTESSRHKIHYVSLLIVLSGWPFLINLFFFSLLSLRVRKKKRHQSWVILNWTYANAVFPGLSARKPERVYTPLWVACSILSINEKKKSLVIYKRNGIREKTGSIFLDNRNRRNTPYLPNTRK